MTNEADHRDKVRAQSAGQQGVPPPEDPEAEESLLGAILLGGRDTFIVAHALVQASDLTRHDNRMVLAAIELVAERDEHIDYSSVAGEMRRLNPHGAGAEEAHSFEPLLVGLMEHVPTHAHVETYAKRVRYCATARRMIGSASEIARIAYAQTEDTEAAMLERVQGEIEKLLMANASSGAILTQRDLATMYTDILERREKGDPTVIGISTGFPDIDRYYKWKLDELVLVASAPSVGKTSLISNFQDDLAFRGVSSLFATAEQAPMQLMDRAVAAQGDLDGWLLAQGRLDENAWTRVNQVLAGRFDLPAYLYYDAGMTTARLSAQVQLAKLRYGIKVVFVDYLQLLADDVEESEYARVSTISRRLKAIAGAHHVCVVAAAQVNKEGSKVEGQVPEARDLRGSGTLWQDADVVMAIGRKPKENVTKVEIRKNRNGPTGGLRLYFEPAQTRFRSLEEHAA
jgi:replicative DNA helicase